MKFPLTLKVSLLLVANLVILIGLGIGWFLSSSADGGHSLVRGPLGDRVQVIADTISRELQSASPDERDALIETFTTEYGVNFLWMRNDGLVLAGPSLPLPDEVRRELVKTHGNRRDGTMPQFGSERPGPPPPHVIPGAANLGRFLIRPESHPDYWFGLRLTPVQESRGPGQRPPEPTTLLIHAESVWSLGYLFGLHLWAGVAAAAVGISILFWFPFVQSASRRLTRLTKATEEIAEGHFDVRTGIKGRDEIHRLGSAVDSMAGRLDTMVNGQKRFLGDVAHELGSPIGRLQVAMEILEQRADEKLKDAITDARDEVQQMSALVNELLAFTKAGLSTPTAEIRSVEMTPILTESISKEDPDGRVTLRLTDGLTARADAPLLARAVANLIRNAIRYAGDSVPITLTATRWADQVHLIVEDEGPGVPAASLPRLGEPFYRPELARTREGGGVGLGLAIVRSAITASGGEVRFSNRQPHGFRAEIILTAGT